MTPAEQLDKRIADIGGWRGELIAKLAGLIRDADPEAELQWKWDTAVWVHGGLVCALGAFKDHVKMNFFRGSELRDPHNLVNSGLTSKTHRAIDFSQGDTIDKAAIKDLVREAVALNAAKR